ncbi:MAG: helix-turn-helix domain-containing protein, partial [Candidatus Eisenbacteria bacterium]|nr:helix-turn-helix domain-containing protein [Candidatus Eisenbacteria bacterium]
MCPVRYYTMIRSKNPTYDLRVKMVKHAVEHGIRDAARAFQCSRNTVRKWLRRYRRHGLRGLVDRSRAPHSCPHKLSPEDEKIILRHARRVPHFSARRLRDEFELPYGVASIARVKRENGLSGKRKKKYQKKNDLRAVKQAYRPFRRFQMDLKYLDDIPNYFTAMEELGLPRYQYTVRELATGAQFLSYADSISATYAEMTVRRLLGHLRRYGIDLSEVDIQTDNGAEFEGRVVRYRKRGFVHTIEKVLGASHTYIPPGCKNANADVESVHATVETDFFDLERFSSRDDFFAKITTYQLYYNLAHPITTRGNRAPLDALRNKDPTLDPNIFLLLPCDLDRTLRHLSLDHDVPDLTALERLTACARREFAESAGSRHAADPRGSAENVAHVMHAILHRLGSR